MTDLDRQWASTQIEAFADGSLPPEQERRMRAVLERDARLREEVRQAQALRQSLKRTLRPAVPAGLAGRLLGIPSAQRAPRRVRFKRAFEYKPAFGAAALVIVAIGAGFFSLTQRERAVEAAAREAALRDFQVAMTYLRKSTAIANSEMNEAVGLGVRNAVMTSREALDEAQRGISEGEWNDVD